MTNLVQFEINFRKSYCQLQCTLQLACEDRVCSSELIFTFLYAGRRIQSASEQFVSCIHLFFANSSSSNPTNKNLTELGLEIQTALSRSPFRIGHVLV